MVRRLRQSAIQQSAIAASLPNPTPCGRTRREFLWQVGGGFASLALVDLLGRDGFFGSSAPAAERHARSSSPLTTHFPAKAKHCIFLFMNGAPSQVDTFDPKPALAKHDGQPYQGKVKVGSNDRPVGYLMQSPFQFSKHGESGLEISDLFPHTAAVRRRPVRAPGDVHRHGGPRLRLPADEHRQPADRQAEPGLVAELRPGLAERQPAELRGDDRPARRADRRRVELGRGLHAGRATGHAVPQRRVAAARPGHARRRQPDARSAQSLDLLKELNEQHAAARPGRKRSWPPASWPTSWPTACRPPRPRSSICRPRTPKTREMYGLNDQLTADFGRKCLITRRLIEQGVRFVQLYSGGGHIEDTWDGHNDCITNHKTHAGETDQPIARPDDRPQAHAACGTRRCSSGAASSAARRPAKASASPAATTTGSASRMWLAGAGVKGGQAIGATDELGFEGVEDRCHVSDLHATILHLMGFDHRRLTYFYNGLDQRLTGVERAANHPAGAGVGRTFNPSAVRLVEASVPGRNAIPSYLLLFKYASKSARSCLFRIVPIPCGMSDACPGCMATISLRTMAISCCGAVARTISSADCRTAMPATLRPSSVRTSDRLITPHEAGTGKHDRFEQIAVASRPADVGQIRTQAAAEVADRMAGRAGRLLADEDLVPAANVARGQLLEEPIELRRLLGQ